MSYPDLQHEIADRVDPPGFEEVLARASGARRRRRTTIGAGLAAGVVVAGLAIAVGDTAGRDGRSEPAGPTRPWDGVSEVHSDLPADVRTLLEAERLDVWGVSGSGGAIGALLGACDGAGACDYAATSRLGDVVEGRVVDVFRPTLFSVPGGWLVAGADGPTRITPSGEQEKIHDVAGSPTVVEAGDTAVLTPTGWRLLRGDKLITMPTPDGAAVESAHVTPAGRLIMATSGEGGFAVSATDDGRSWATAPVDPALGTVAGALVTGHGDHVAVALLGDAPDGSIPVLDVHVSHDAGAGWLSVGASWKGIGGKPRDLSAMAVSDEGTVFLTAGSHGLVRIDLDGNATASQMSSHDHSVFLVAHRVCLVTEAGRVDHLQCSHDDGLTWTHEPLPGFR